uniref:Uncharacterized protein n=1 Tax=Romanomermis culicivorax TaxID=13658 RepID=A0A915HXX1_ROMCU
MRDLDQEFSSTKQIIDSIHGGRIAGLNLLEEFSRLRKGYTHIIHLWIENMHKKSYENKWFPFYVFLISLKPQLYFASRRRKILAPIGAG